MNERESGSTENGSTETKPKIEPVSPPVFPVAKPTQSFSDSEPEYRVQVLLPELLLAYPKHVVHAVLAEHGLTAKSLATKTQLVSLVEAWLKGAVNG